MKIGDVVGFVFAQPGNDTTYGVITAVGPLEMADFYDLFFDVQIKNVSTKKLWPATDRELGDSINKHGKSVTVRELADAYRATSSPLRGVGPKTEERQSPMEARAGVEPTYSDLQSSKRV